MADQMPFNIAVTSFGQRVDLWQEFLHAVFAERTLPISVGFFDLIDGVILAHRNELHRTVVRMTRSAVVFNMFMDGFKIFCN